MSMTEEGAASPKTRVVPDSQLEDCEHEDLVLWRGEPFTGISYENDEDGRVWSVAGYLKGEPHGPQRVWRTNGLLHFERYFMRWRRHGPYREWNEEGQLREETYHDRGVLISERKWDDAGRLKHSYLLTETGTDEAIHKLQTRRTEIADQPVVDIEDWQFVERPEGWGHDEPLPEQARPKNPTDQ